MRAFDRHSDGADGDWYANASLPGDGVSRGSVEYVDKYGLPDQRPWYLDLDGDSSPYDGWPE